MPVDQIQMMTKMLIAQLEMLPFQLKLCLIMVVDFVQDGSIFKFM
jgi:hypothetical protein